PGAGQEGGAGQRPDGAYQRRTPARRDRAGPGQDGQARRPGLIPGRLDYFCSSPPCPFVPSPLAGEAPLVPSPARGEGNKSMRSRMSWRRETKKPPRPLRAAGVSSLTSVAPYRGRVTCRLDAKGAVRPAPPRSRDQILERR